MRTHKYWEDINLFFLMFWISDMQYITTYVLSLLLLNVFPSRLLLGLSASWYLKTYFSCTYWELSIFLLRQTTGDLFNCYSLCNGSSYARLRRNWKGSKAVARNYFSLHVGGFPAKFIAVHLTASVASM